ncbi:hypothetical protein B0H19DRAFT_476635 [Mycena capillaripes]|nr:hypothetical protein B0H19DRAFT_476635 [Mycena capillaripes]
MSQGGYDSEDSHQVTHLVARHCSPVAFEQFTVALEDLGVQCPALKTLVHQMNLLWLAKIAHGPMVRGKWSVFIPRFQVSVNGAVTTDSLEVHHFKNAVELDYSQRGGHTIHNAAKLINAARRPNAPPPTQTFAQSANGDSLPPLPPLAYMYTAADPLVANRRTSAYPQTILWRVNYAVACALRWGSDDIKALIFGWKPPPLPLVATPLAKKRKLETPGGSEATQEEEIADEAAEGDEEAAQDEDEEEAAERECMEHLKDRARVCEFVISNFLRTQEDSVMVVDLDQPLVS